MYIGFQLLVAALIFNGANAFVSQQDTARIRRRHQKSMPFVATEQPHQHYSKYRPSLLYSTTESNNNNNGNDWLSQISPETVASKDNDDKLAPSPSFEQLQLQQADDIPQDLGNVQIPSTGVSVTEQLEKANQDKFESTLVPIKGLPSVAQIVTTANDGYTEPVRYLASLSPLPKAERNDDNSESNDASEDSAENCGEETAENSPPHSFVLVDIPPFDEKLLAQMRKFIKDGKLVALIITSRDAIHYDEAPAVYTTRRSDLVSWTLAFPDAQVIGYRLDIPRDCRELITQRLDGYGPWALEEASGKNVTFVETGRPLTYEEWDQDVAKQVMEEGMTPPDDDSECNDDEDLYTPEAIKSREDGKRLLAIYTPGHTFGSVTYIFPEVQACFSGYTIPIEDDRYDESLGAGGAGPALDFRGYITTSRAGMSRMMESARHVVDTYSDRFSTVFPSRGDPLFVDGSDEDRRDALNDIIDQYDKIGKIYEQLGITSSSQDE